MTNFPASLIVQYTGDYDPSNADTFKCACNQIQRYIEEEIGQYQIEATATRRLLSLKVTEVFMTRSRLSYYTSWLDGRDFSIPLGLMVTNTYIEKQKGVYSAINAEKKDTISKESDSYPYLETEPKGSVFVEYLNTEDYSRKNKYVGVGKGLMQVAIELSHLKKLSGKVFLTSSNNSPGFYKRLGFINVDPVLDKQIDKEMEAATKEKRKPDTTDWAGCTMILNTEGLAVWNKIIKEKSIIVSKTLGSK